MPVVPKLNKEQFSQVYKHLRVPDVIPLDDVYECYDFAFDNALKLMESNVFGKSQPLNNIVLILYLVNEYGFYFSVSKEVKDKDEALSKIISVALDKYFTNEMLDYRNQQYTSRFSPAISTIQLYLNFVLGILKNFPQKNPQETLLVDMANKAFNISKAIIELIITGFETEAFSTWRTLHETECILLLINKYGDKIISSYLKHMRYALAYRGAIPNKEEVDAEFVKIKEEMHALDLKSKDMKKFIEYGWLTSIDNYNEDPQFKFNFRDGVERLAGLSNYSKVYEMASEIAHSSPLLIYSRPQYYYHMAILELYESFFRLERVFSEIYIKRINQNEARRYLAMRNVYYSTLQIIYQNESRIFLNQRKTKEEKKESE